MALSPKSWRSPDVAYTILGYRARLRAGSPVLTCKSGMKTLFCGLDLIGDGLQRFRRHKLSREIGAAPQGLPMLLAQAPSSYVVVLNEIIEK